MQYKRYEEALKKGDKEENVNIWDSIVEESEVQEQKTDRWTTLNDLVLRLTPYKTIPGMFIHNQSHASSLMYF